MFGPLNRYVSPVCHALAEDNDSVCPNCSKDTAVPLDFGLRGITSQFQEDVLPRGPPRAWDRCPDEGWDVTMRPKVRQCKIKAGLRGEVVLLGESCHRAALGPLSGLADFAAGATAQFEDVSVLGG